MNQKRRNNLIKNITPLSFILVIIIFSLQLISLYKLYQSNVNLLLRELNLATDEIYQTDLNARLVKNSKTGKPNIRYQPGDAVKNTNPEKIHKFSNSTPKKNVVSTLNLAVEEFLSKKYPINLEKIDSIAQPILIKYHISLSSYSEIIDLEANEIEASSASFRLNPKSILASKNIFLNVAQTKALRIVLINPMEKVFYNMSWMFLLSFFLCLVCIYSFYFHRKTLSEQKELARLKSDLFGDISHEFKQPLSVLRQVTSSLANERIIAMPEKRERYLRIANEEIAKMVTQTEMILSISMDDEGVLSLHYCKFDIKELISILIGNFEETSTKDVDFQFICETENTLVEADVEHMEHVLSNLISNAIKYSNQTVQITIKLYRERNFIVVSVKDNGLGISQEDLAHIFERYSRVGKTSVSKGHGIGLNYVKRIVAKHNGKIEVRSELGKGSEFIIKIPQFK